MLFIVDYRHVLRPQPHEPNWFEVMLYLKVVDHTNSPLLVIL